MQKKTTLWYHGTVNLAKENMIAQGVDVRYPGSIRKKDFGLGFYLTSDLQMARNWANRAQRLVPENFIGQRRIYAEVICFEIDLVKLNQHFYVRDFGLKLSLDWAEFVVANRLNSLQKMANEFQFDAVHGLVADGKNLKELCYKFKNGNAVSKQKILKEMQFRGHPDFDQLCIGSQEAMDQCVRMLK